MTPNHTRFYGLWDLTFLTVIAGYVLFGLWGVSILSVYGHNIS